MGTMTTISPSRSRTRNTGCVLLILILLHLGIIPNSRVLYPIVWVLYPTNRVSPNVNPTGRHLSYLQKHPLVRGYLICHQCISGGQVVTQMQPLHRWQKHEWYDEAMKPKPAAKPKQAKTRKKAVPVRKSKNDSKAEVPEE